MDHLKAPDRLAYAVAPKAGLLATDGPGLKKKDERHPGPKRLAWGAAPPAIDAVVGQPIDVTLPTLFNIGPTAATARVTSSSPAATVVASPHHLTPSTAMQGAALGDALHAIVVRVAPSAVGTTTCTITATGRWVDGREDARITLTILARRPESMAPDVADAIAAKQDEERAAPSRASLDQAAIARVGTAADAPASAEIADELTRWQLEVGRVGDLQQAGVTAVETAQLAYKRKPPPTTITWGDIAAGAIGVATAGIAGSLGKIVVDRLKASIDEVAAAGIGDAVKECVKRASKEAVTSDPRRQASGPADASLPTFFLAQRDMAINARHGIAEGFVDVGAQLRRAAAADPPGTLARMQATREGMKAQHGFVSQMQRSATSAALGQYLAQARLGEELAKGRSGDRTVEAHATRAAGAAKRERHASGGADPTGTDGVLDLFMPSGGTTIIESRLLGMGKANVEALVGQRIGALMMPVRFVLGRHEERQARITRDEAGRCTFDGDDDVLQTATSDLPADASRATRVAAVVERALRQVVPGNIESDDDK